MLNFKGNIVFSHVESIPTKAGGKFERIVCYHNTGFNQGPAHYIYKLSLSKALKDGGFMQQVKGWPRHTTVSVAGYISSVEKPSRTDPEKKFEQVGLVANEVSLAMVQQPAPMNAQQQQQYIPEPQYQPQLMSAPQGGGFDDIPF